MFQCIENDDFDLTSLKSLNFVITLKIYLKNYIKTHFHTQDRKISKFNFFRILGVFDENYGYWAFLKDIGRFG